MPILLATLTTREPVLTCWSLLIVVFLLFTLSVSSPAIARAALRNCEGTERNVEHFSRTVRWYPLLLLQFPLLHFVHHAGNHRTDESSPQCSKEWR